MMLPGFNRASLYIGKYYQKKPDVGDTEEKKEAQQL